MSIRHLDFFFEPRSVAVIGASERPRSVGATVWHNLGAGGYAGALYAVNPKHGKVGTARCWPDVASLPAAPELAVVCTPADSVAGLIAELGARGTRAAVVLTAGQTAAQRQAMLDAARPFMDSVAVTLPYLKGRSVGGAFMVLGHLVFAAHFMALTLGFGPQRDKPADVVCRRTLLQRAAIDDIVNLAEIDAVQAKFHPLAGEVYTLERDTTGRHGSIMKYNLNKT